MAPGGRLRSTAGAPNMGKGGSHVWVIPDSG